VGIKVVVVGATGGIGFFAKFKARTEVGEIWVVLYWESNGTYIITRRIVEGMKIRKGFVGVGRRNLNVIRIIVVGKKNVDTVGRKYGNIKFILVLDTAGVFRGWLRR
jgi:hypothetical protein